MGFWSLIALCVVCGCALEAYRSYVKSKTARGAGLADLEARIAALEGGENLEERVRILESIVTDPKFQLDREISSLKD